MNKQLNNKILFFALGIAFSILCIFTASAIKSEVDYNTVYGTLLNSGINGLVNTPSIETQGDNSETRNKPSPMNYFSESQIKVYKDRVILDAQNIQWATFTDTKSMLPTISNESNALQIVPVCPDEIALGDIVSYVSQYADGIIIHRVVFIGNDDEGIYFILKGDNNPTSDPGKIRCSQIQRKVVAIIY
jgi:hypothetical protein